MKERKPLTREFAARYRAAQSTVEKSTMLNDFISAAGKPSQNSGGAAGNGGH